MFAQLEEKLSISRSRKQSSVFLQERDLRAAFLLRGEIVAWRCNLCQRLFTIWEHRDVPSVSSAFDRHSCALAVFAELQGIN